MQKEMIVIQAWPTQNKLRKNKSHQIPDAIALGILITLAI